MFFPIYFKIVFRKACFRSILFSAFYLRTLNNFLKKATNLTLTPYVLVWFLKESTYIVQLIYDSLYLKKVFSWLYQDQSRYLTLLLNNSVSLKSLVHLLRLFTKVMQNCLYAKCQLRF